MKKGTTLNIKVKPFLDSKVTTREDGEALRDYLQSQWEQVEVITLDFRGLQIASVSFLDEAFGMLAEAYPKKEIGRKIRVVRMDANDQIMYESILKSRESQFRKTKRASRSETVN